MPNRANMNRGNDLLIPGKAVNELGTVQPLLADTATGRLLVTITSDSGAATGLSGGARIDGQNVSTITACVDDGTGHPLLDGNGLPVIVPLARDTDGNLLCDLA